MEESVLVKDLSCSLRIVVISEHDIRSLYTNLSFAVLIRIVDLHAACENRCSDAAGLAVFVSVGRNQRRTFGNSIAVENGYSKRIKITDDFFIKLRSAADDQFQFAAECTEYASKQFPSDVNADFP